jgi:hypothetical protein
MMDEELRRILREKAASFGMSRSLPNGMVDKVRRRLVQRVVGLVAAVTVVATAAVLVHGGDATRPVLARGSGGSVTTAVRLVGYDEPYDQGDPHPQASDDEGPAGLRRFAACMRDEGFDVPDPVPTDEGWSILVAPGGEIPSGPAWREAAFVTCRPADFSLSGDLVLGWRTSAEVERFAACLRREGFDLPAPTRAPNDEHVFDLRDLVIDTASDEWSRAVFVTCAPGDVAP